MHAPTVCRARPSGRAADGYPRGFWVSVGILRFQLYIVRIDIDPCVDLDHLSRQKGQSEGKQAGGGSCDPL